MTKNAEIFGVLNTSLIFTEVTANLGSQPVLGEMGDDRVLHPKGVAPLVLPLCTCVCSF